MTALDDAPLRRVLAPSLAFVASFSAIFVLLGMSATRLGAAMRDQRVLLEKVSATVIIALGALLASLFATRLNREWRVDTLMTRACYSAPTPRGSRSRSCSARSPSGR